MHLEKSPVCRLILFRNLQLLLIFYDILVFTMYKTRMLVLLLLSNPWYAENRWNARISSWERWIMFLFRVSNENNASNYKKISTSLNLLLRITTSKEEWRSSLAKDVKKFRRVLVYWNKCYKNFGRQYRYYYKMPYILCYKLMVIVF